MAFGRAMSIPFERYLNVQWAAGASVRHDGTRLVFRSDITGVAQVWTMETPGDWPVQLTFAEDRVEFAQYHPSSNLVAFGRDVGGDENTMIYLVSDDGGVPELASVQQAKHQWGGWSPDGKFAAWTHNGRNGVDFDVYVYDVESKSERCVFEAEGYWYVSDWLPDASGLLLIRAESNEYSELHLLKFDSQPHQLTPDAYAYVDYARATNEAIFYATNLDSDFLHVRRMGFDGANTTVVFAPDCDVEGIRVHPDFAQLAVSSNQDGYSSLDVVDLATGETRSYLNNTGVLTSFDFVPGGLDVIGTMTTAVQSYDIYQFSADEEPVRWTRSSMGGLPASVLKPPELVRYESFDGLQIPGFLYRPSQESGFGVVIDIHGGPEGQRRPAFFGVMQYLVNQGFAVFSPNVRGSRGYGKNYMALDNVRNRMDSVKDIRAAYDFLVGQGADPNRIALMGGSYGGFMVLSSMVTYPDLWAAGVDVVGIANFVTFLENTSAYRRKLREAEYGSLEEDRDFLESISPSNHMRNIAAPLMVIHGRNDPRVPVSEAELVVATAREVGVDVECIIYDDEGHGLAKRANRLDAYPRIAEFLARYLG